MAENKLACPKCGSAAFGATKSTIPTSQIYKVNLMAKCLHCGSEFALADK